MNIALELHNTTGKGLIEILVNQKYVDEQYTIYHICVIIILSFFGRKNDDNKRM